MQVVMEKLNHWYALSFEDARKLVVEKAEEAYKNGSENNYVFLVYANYGTHENMGVYPARIAGCLPRYHAEHYIVQFHKVRPEATYNVIMYSPRWDFLDGNFCSPVETHQVNLRWENLENELKRKGA